eukprot:3967583-Amphidinium_carterae.1
MVMNMFAACMAIVMQLNTRFEHRSGRMSVSKSLSAKGCMESHIAAKMAQPRKGNQADPKCHPVPQKFPNGGFGNFL